MFGAVINKKAIIPYDNTVEIRRHMRRQPIESETSAYPLACMAQPCGSIAVPSEDRCCVPGLSGKLIVRDDAAPLGRSRLH